MFCFLIPGIQIRTFVLAKQVLMLLNHTPGPQILFLIINLFYLKYGGISKLAVYSLVTISGYLNQSSHKLSKTEYSASQLHWSAFDEVRSLWPGSYHVGQCRYRAAVSHRKCWWAALVVWKPLSKSASTDICTNTKRNQKDTCLYNR